MDLFKAFLLLGTNLGNKTENLEKSIQKLGSFFKIVNESSVFETEPWGNPDQPVYYNQAIEIETGFVPHKVLQICEAIEKEMGRVRGKKWEARIIDIDILYYDDLVINDEKLIVPHPFIAERNFVLEPLCQIAPSFIHPALKLSNQELFERSSDTLKVLKVM